MNNLQWAWLFKMAWRDSRRNRGKLMLFIASIVVGIAALVAINSFSANLQKDINEESKSLLAADLLVDGNQAPDEALQARFKALNAQEQAHAKNFLSFIYFPQSGQSKMAQVKALEGNYPFYGTLMTRPAEAAASFRGKKQALVENGLMLQFDLEVGDTVRVGNAYFEIAGRIDGAPGRSALAGAFAPLVLIPMEYLAETDLLQFGSRVEYQYFFKFDETTDVDALAMEQLKPVTDTLAYSYDTVQERKQDFSQVFGILGNFLNLVGFIALLLGCIGVASSVHIYIKDKLRSVAVLRCLGASGQQAFLIFLIQIGGNGLARGCAGCIIGQSVTTRFAAYPR
ncbi:MAG: ABC transporter permease [Bacteroidota bacterium]